MCFQSRHEQLARAEAFIIARSRYPHPSAKVEVVKVERVTPPSPLRLAFYEVVVEVTGRYLW